MKNLILSFSMVLLCSSVQAGELYCGSRGQTMSDFSGKNSESIAFFKLKTEALDLEPMFSGGIPKNYITQLSGMMIGALDSTIRLEGLDPRHAPKVFWERFDFASQSRPLLLLPDFNSGVQADFLFGDVLPLMDGDLSLESFAVIRPYTYLTPLDPAKKAGQTLSLRFIFAAPVSAPGPAGEYRMNLSCGDLSSPDFFAQDLGWSAELNQMNLPCQRKVILDALADILTMRNSEDRPWAISFAKTSPKYDPAYLDYKQYIQDPSEGAYGFYWGSHGHLAVYDRATCTLKRRINTYISD
ncbi:hypothetical protein K2X30_14825 [bacterium]|nr:hypothetical protein [bacterium]